MTTEWNCQDYVTEALEALKEECIIDEDDESYKERAALAKEREILWSDVENSGAAWQRPQRLPIVRLAYPRRNPPTTSRDIFRGKRNLGGRGTGRWSHPPPGCW